jgi:putative methanogenesis marker protein 5
MIEEAQAGIIVNESPMAFGCMGCARTNELTKYLIRQREMPILEVDYPREGNDEEAKEFVYKIAEFLKSLPGDEEEDKA